MINWKKILVVMMTGITAVGVAAFAACNSGDSGNEKDEHLHTLVVKEAKEATCAEEGNVKYWYCSDCGKYFTDADAENETTLAAVTLARIDHELAKTFATEADCTTDGNLDYWYCLVCEKYYSDENAETETTLEEVTIKAAHNLTHYDAVEATTEHGGNIEYWSCSVCGKYYTDAQAKNETTEEDVKTPQKVDETHIHSLTKTDSEEAGCTTDGNLDYWYCEGCGKYFSDENGATETTLEEVTIKAAHKLTHHEGVEEGCTTEGKMEYWECSVCEKLFTDENAENETTAEEIIIPASHKLTNHPAVEAQWKTDGSIEYWTCDICEKYFLDENGTTEITADDTVIAAVEAPDPDTTGSAVYFENNGTQGVGNLKGKTDFWTASNWATYSSSNLGSYANGSAVPTLVAEDGDTARHLLFTQAARFELFHVPGTGTSFTHLGENSQTGGSQWGNAAFSELYGNTFIYTFDVTANGAFAFEIFGLASSKADRSGQGTSLLFNKNTIEFYAPNTGGGAQILKSIATLPSDFDFGDSEHHTITLSINRSQPEGGNSIIDYRIYVDGYMVRFVNVAGISDDASINANKDGTLKITIGNSGFGQRLSIIPQINSEDGADTATYTQVCIFDLKVRRYPAETENETVLTQSIDASLNEFFPDEQY